jgi:hypothetical protein
MITGKAGFENSVPVTSSRVYNIGNIKKVIEID